LADETPASITTSGKFMKTFFKSRSFLGLIITALVVSIAYALMAPKAAIPVLNNTAAPADAPPANGAAARNSSPGMFAWGGLDNQRKSSYADMDPKEFAMKESDYGGHPAYNKAKHYLSCADYINSSKNISQDLAEHSLMDPSGKSADFAMWQVALKEEECKSVTKDDLAKIDELMHAAAKAGDARAQSYELGKDANQLIEAARTRSREHPDLDAAVSDEEKNLLGRATALAEKGDQEAIFLAARLTATNRFGQQDVTASAAWALVGMQEKGQLFNATSRVFEDEPYSALTPEQKQTAAQQAQQLFSRCCAKR
jgi:hypothetical protein